MTQSFADRLLDKIQEKKSIVCVGLDPRLDRLPAALVENAKPPAAATAFCKGIIDAVADIVPVVKPNIAFFESFGTLGVMGYSEVCRHAQEKGLLVIGDVKRGDIGSTAEAYADGLLGTGGAGQTGEGLLNYHDSITLNPYLGEDGIAPFVTRADENGQGLWVLVKTSNPSSAQLQNLVLASGGTVAEHIAGLVSSWGEPLRGTSGISSVGAVVGATHGRELARFRELMPHTPFLLPGYGAQGAGADDIVGAFGEGGTGGVVNASRSIIYAWKTLDTIDFAGAARDAAIAMNTGLNSALGRSGKGI